MFEEPRALEVVPAAAAAAAVANPRPLPGLSAVGELSEAPGSEQRTVAAAVEGSSGLSCLTSDNRSGIKSREKKQRVIIKCLTRGLMLEKKGPWSRKCLSPLSS